MKLCSYPLLTLAVFFLTDTPRPLVAEDLFPTQSKITSPEIRKAFHQFETDKEQLESTYQTVLADLQSKYHAAVEAAQAKLKANLDKARQEATMQNQLDEAVTIRDAIREAEALTIEPPSLDSDSAAPASMPAPSDSPDKPKPLAEMSIRETQQAIAGKWQGNNGDVWVIYPSGLLDIYTNKKTLRNIPLSFRYLNGKVFLARFDSNGHYVVYFTKDFQTIVNSYGNKFKLHKVAPEEN